MRWTWFGFGLKFRCAGSGAIEGLSEFSSSSSSSTSLSSLLFLTLGSNSSRSGISSESFFSTVGSNLIFPISFRGSCVLYLVDSTAFSS